MAFKMKGFPEHHGTKSPMRTHENGAVHEEESDANSAGDFSNIVPTTTSTKLGSLVDGSRSQAEIDKEQALKNEDQATQEKGVTNEAGDIKDKGLDTELPPELKWHEKAAWQDSGAGHIAEAFKSIRKGLKNRKAKKSAKKTQNIADAKEAVGSGTETLKQAKLVEKNRKKVDRKAKRNIKSDAKDKEKLAEYRKKNPVRGKEAINLLETQTKKDKKLKDRYGTGANAAKKAGKTGDEPTGLEL